MKQWILLLAATATFASCSKDSLEQEIEQQSLLETESTSATSFSRTAQNNVYVSEWEQGASWSSHDSADMRIYTYQASLPQITDDVMSNGVVVSFAKMMNTPEGFENYRNPQRLDFAFVPAYSRVVKGAYLMRDDAAMGSVKLTYAVPLTTDGATAESHLLPPNYQVQHVVIPAEFLSANGLTQAGVMGYTYTQLMDAVTPK